MSDLLTNLKDELSSFRWPDEKLPRTRELPLNDDACIFDQRRKNWMNKRLLQEQNEKTNAMKNATTAEPQKPALPPLDMEGWEEGSALWDVD